jgi:hypothetical protein
MVVCMNNRQRTCFDLGLTLRTVRSGNYRVNFRDGNETTAYYTDDLEDAVNTAVEMARKRGVWAS